MKSLWLLGLAVLVGSLVTSFAADPPWSWLAGFVYILYDTLLIAITFVTLVRSRASHPTTLDLNDISGEPSSAPTLTVVISFFNEKKSLKACWDHLCVQTRKPELVLFVDDGSEQASPEWLRRLAADPNSGVQLLVKPHTGKADSLNRALKTIQTDYFVTLDADTLLEPDALEKLCEALTVNPTWTIGGGLLTPNCENGVWAKFLETFQKFEYKRAFLNRLAWSHWNCLNLVSGAFAFYRTQLVQEVGGFATQSLVEDYELTTRLYEQALGKGRDPSFHVAVLGQARAQTDCPNTPLRLLRQRQRWFGGFLQTHWHYRRLIGQSEVGNFGKILLPLKSSDTLQPLFGLVALGNLLFFLILRRKLHWLVLAVLIAKLVLDLIFHYWGLFLYQRWTGEQLQPKTWILSFFVTLAEPFFFQPLRHLGAALGYLLFWQRNPKWHASRPQ